MTLKKAHEIIQAYGALLGVAKEGNLFFSRKKLPCSVARIKFAIYRYVLELARTGQLNKEIVSTLIIAYSHLAFFTQETEAHKLNKLILSKGKIPEDILEEAPELEQKLKMLNYYKELLNREIQEFINEAIQLQAGEKI